MDFFQQVEIKQSPPVYRTQVQVSMPASIGI